ncbi:uncharacterized protein B0T23DRAFT_448757 [Neurospora hispaniola]|uniref:Uncharacterized protein n=1 Tax=Neurospora hispaniola TaxID=588809 RepID=A0AAJ0HZN4_9PEZI|nr:hypothetical protein B0T23DRAFT_448757 [Neurospora hispaniola]
MSYHELLNVIEPVESGLFNSLIESLNSLPNSNTEKWWETLAGKVADCQTGWNKCYAFLTQTVTELCTALEALSRWTNKLTQASGSLAEGRDVEIIDEDQISTTVTKTIKDARDLIKGEEAKTQKQLEEVESRTTAAVVEEMHSAFYLDVLGADLGITHPEALKRYLRTLLPRSISLAVKAAEKDRSAPRVRQQDLVGSHGTTTSSLTQDSASTSALFGGQAAPRN